MFQYVSLIQAKLERMNQDAQMDDEEEDEEEEGGEWEEEVEDELMECDTPFGGFRYQQPLGRGPRRDSGTMPWGAAKKTAMKHTFLGIGRPVKKKPNTSDVSKLKPTL